MSATSGNGSRRWTVETTDVFEEDRERLESEHPRLVAVFGVVRAQMAVQPTYRARELAGETWLYRTRRALGAPALFIYFEIRHDDRLVCLLAADRAEA